MHLATGHPIASITSDISAYNTLAKQASQAVHDEYEALEQLYSKILDRYQVQSLDSGWRGGAFGGEHGRWEEEDQEVHETVTLVSRELGNSRPSEDAGVGRYIQVVVDCTSLKFILDSGKRGYVSGTQLVNDLSDLIDRFLAPPIAGESQEDRETTPRPWSATNSGFPDVHPPSRPIDISERTTTCSTETTVDKRFTFLVDLDRHIDKNYPLRKEKARTFVAGLHDAPGVELVYVGLGKKSVEDHMKETINHHLSNSQCTSLFIAVGITSNTSHHVLNLSRTTLLSLSRHPNAGKTCIMRSGGPFDRSYGIASVAIDKYLSVQMQVPPYRAGREEDEKRERRSFAPSPVAASRRLMREEKNQEARATPIAALSDLHLDVGTEGAEGITRDEGQATPMALSQFESPTTELLTTFDPLDIQNTHGKPLCAKYHLNRGSCQCGDTTHAIHDELTLSPAASKQLAVWAADQACPEGLGCADAVERKCCHWFHEPGAGAGEAERDGAKDETDEWISVDKKGKPIVPKSVQVNRVWQPSASCKSSGKLVRHDFHPLLSTIRQFERERNEYKHERGLIGTELKRAYGHDLYRRLSLSGFREYTGLAEKAGLIKLGYFGESAGWIALA